MAAIAAAALASAPTPVHAAGVPAYDHVFVIVMENTGYGSIIGSPSAPYINSLASSGALATNYFAITHPSLPNYLALTGGSTYGIASDCTTCWINATNIADNIESAGSTWKAYLEAMPSPCYVGDSYPYAQKHNPFVYFNDIRNNASRCQAHDVPYSQLATDLGSASTTPNYAFITPDMCNDMHDCSVATGDSWLSSNVPQILNSPAFTTQHSLLALTWDEDDTLGTNQVATIFVGSGVAAGSSSGTAYNHYSLLRTIESARGLATVNSGDKNAAAMADMFGSSSPPPPPTTPCTGVTVSTSPSVPSLAGTTVTVSAAATSCPNPLYQFMIRPASSSTWQTVQPYSTSATYQWNSTGAAPGIVYLGVWARDASSTASSDASASTPFTISTPSPSPGPPPPSVTCASVTISPAGPLSSGTPATFTATATGCSSARFEFWMRPATNPNWQLIQAYSSSAAYQWNSTGALPGTVYFGVWAVGAGSSAAYDAVVSTPVTVTDPSCASVTVSASPTTVTHSTSNGTHVTVTATGAGCTTTARYEFWIRPASSSTWQMVRAYGTGNTYDWNTTGALSGTVYVGVHIKDAGSTNDYDAVASTPVTVN